MESDRRTLSPDEAYKVVANETRIGILRTLGEADGPLSFTEVRERVGIRQGSQFNYHLDKLVGHFVAKLDDGYVLREPGRRVIQAILSGAVTGDPEMEPTRTTFPCRHCEAPVEVSYRHGKVRLSCRSCGGNIDRSTTRPAGAWDDASWGGNLGDLPLPPAAIQGRTADGVLRAAATRGHLEILSATGDVCPRCSASIEHTIHACTDHDAGDTFCDRCDSRLAVSVSFACTNCIYEERAFMVMALLDVPELLAFVGDHGLNTTADGIKWGWEYDEEVLSTDPFEGRFTFTIDGDSLTLTVDEHLDVTEVSR